MDSPRRRLKGKVSPATRPAFSLMAVSTHSDCRLPRCLYLLQAAPAPPAPPGTPWRCWGTASPARPGSSIISFFSCYASTPQGWWGLTWEATVGPSTMLPPPLPASPELCAVTDAEVCLSSAPEHKTMWPPYTSELTINFCYPRCSRPPMAHGTWYSQGTWYPQGTWYSYPPSTDRRAPRNHRWFLIYHKWYKQHFVYGVLWLIINYLHFHMHAWASNLGTYIFMLEIDIMVISQKKFSPIKVAELSKWHIFSLPPPQYLSYCSLSEHNSGINLSVYAITWYGLFPTGGSQENSDILQPGLRWSLRTDMGFIACP